MRIWFEAFRWKNLVIATTILLAFRIGIHEPIGFPSRLPDWAFGLAVLSTIFAMAYGYLINDIRDRTTDEVNKPERAKLFKKHTLEEINVVAYALAASSMLIGAFLAMYIDRWRYIALPAITLLLLHQYAHHLKGRPFIGNVLVAFLASLMVVSLLAFDVLPVLENNVDIKNQFQGLVYIYLAFAGFAFHITLIREIVKDLEDVEGDKRAGYRTLPIVIGERPSRLIAFLLALIFSIISIRFTIAVWQEDYSYWLIYAIVAVYSLYILYLLRPGERLVNYKIVQRTLKILMLMGILLLPLLSFIG
ncbi:MAG: hypothetical protein EA358_05675 [Flavobacteriales bacterium]|nr:MAG: hypothetical protein EA358_05675 [Flavobacteriales bacterium]